MKLLLTCFLISIFLASCSDSPVSPVAENQNIESNTFRNQDLKNNSNFILKSNQILELKIDGELLTNSNQNDLITTVKFKTDKEGLYDFDIKDEKIIVKIIDESGNEIASTQSDNPVSSVYLSRENIYQIEIRNSKIRSLKLNDLIYVRLNVNRVEEQDNISVSVNSCEDCTFTNTTFTGQLNNVSYNRSKFYLCYFNNISATNCSFDSADILDSEFTISEFFSTIFSNVNFINTNFGGVNFGVCNFEYGSFNSGFLLNVMFVDNGMTHMLMNNVNIGEVSIYSSVLSYAKIASQSLSFSPDDIVFSDSDFSNAQISNINLTNSTLSGSNFTESDFTGSNLSGANIQGARFLNTNLNNVIFCGVQGSPSIFKGVSQLGTKCPYKQ